MTGCIADLHVHSTASDGVLSPTELLRLASELGIEYFSICDHDTAAGVGEAATEGQRLNVRVIPGIEIGCGKQGLTHLLGYGINPEYEPLLRFTARIKESRVKRFRLMAEKITLLNMPIDADALLSELPSDCSAGRPHIAREMVSKGYVSSVKEAFERYLSPGQPGYVERWEPSIEEALAIIRQSGGLPVLAHPECSGGTQMLLQWVEHLKGMGLAGVECHHPIVSWDTRCALVSYCDKAGMLVTGGSDFHDAAQGHQLGYAGMPWPDAKVRVLELIKAIGAQILS